MPWAGGVFSLLPVSHAEPGTTIRAEQQNAPHEDFASGLNNCLTRDGSTTMLANLPMNGRKVVNLAAGTNPADAVRLDQLPASSAWLEAVAALTMAADRFPYATGPEAAALATLTAFARTLLDDADAPAARATLGLTIATAALAVLNAAVDHNTAAWEAGTATTPGFPTPAQVRASASILTIGVGQTWQEVTRTAATIYTNSTGKPIQICAKAQNTGSRFQVSPSSGDDWVTVAASEADGHISANFIVPNTWRYRFLTTGTAPITFWSELR